MNTFSGRVTRFRLLEWSSTESRKNSRKLLILRRASQKKEPRSTIWLPRARPSSRVPSRQRSPISVDVKTTVDGVHSHATEKAIDTYLPRKADDEEDEEFQDADDMELDNASSIVEKPPKTLRLQNLWRCVTTRAQESSSAIERIKVAKLQSNSRRSTMTSCTTCRRHGHRHRGNQGVPKDAGEKAYAAWMKSASAPQVLTMSLSPPFARVHPQRLRVRRKVRRACSCVRRACQPGRQRKVRRVYGSDRVRPRRRKRSHSRARVHGRQDPACRRCRRARVAQSRVVDPAVAKAQDARKALEASGVSVQDLQAESRTKRKVQEERPLQRRKHCTSPRLLRPKPLLLPP